MSAATPFFFQKFLGHTVASGDSHRFEPFTLILNPEISRVMGPKKSVSYIRMATQSRSCDNLHFRFG